MTQAEEYKKAGVDLSKSNRITTQIQERIQDTYSPNVVTKGANFSGSYALNGRNWLFSDHYDDPVLLSATDGVGTKLEIARKADRFETIGEDLVAMSVNDVMANGARPLFFLDYVSSGELDPQKVMEIVDGIVRGCKTSGCSLIGGETAEMPGFFSDNQYELVGFCVGVAERSRMVDGSKISSGDVLIGFPSSGLHSNGFSLVRSVLLNEQHFSLDDSPDELDHTLEEELLTPTEIYAPALRALFNHYQGRMPIKGMAHITGGGLYENMTRILPESCTAHLDPENWNRPAIFDLIRKYGDISLQEMFHDFNMGIGMVLACDPYFADAMIRKVNTWVPNATKIGTVQEGKGTVHIEGVDSE